MGIVDGSLQLGYKDTAWFTANATLVLLVGQIVYLEQTGTYKLGDGTTQLSALSFLGGSGSGLSGLTTNKVLKAGSATTAVDSNITDDGTTVGIVTGNSQIYALPTEAGFYYFENNTGIVKVNDSGTYLQHDDLIDLNAPSVTKNGVEVATVNDIPTVDTTIIDGSTNAVSGNAVFDGLATKLDATKERLLDTVGFSALSPSDATTYYFGEMFYASPPTLQSSYRFQLNENATITRAVILVRLTTVPSNESISFYIRESATTDYTLTTSLNANTITSNISKSFIYSGLSIAITAGNDYEMKMVTPTWVTNPTNFSILIKLYGY